MLRDELLGSAESKENTKIRETPKTRPVGGRSGYNIKVVRWVVYAGTGAL